MKLLFLAPFTPRAAAEHGGGRVMAGLIGALAEDHEVALFCLRAPDEPPTDDMLRARCAKVRELATPRQIGRSARLRQRLRVVAGRLAGNPEWVTRCASSRLRSRAARYARSWKPDVVQFEYHVMGQYADEFTGAGRVRVLNQHECGTRAAADRHRAAEGAFERSWRLLERRAWERYERSLGPRLDAIVVFTDADLQAMRELVPDVRLRRIPFGTALADRALDPAGARPPSILFVGNFRHPPNVGAALRLARRIFPGIRSVRPDVRLYLVGTAPPDRLLALSGPDVVVTGHVPDVEPYMDRAAVVVAPLASGGGMRVKVVEALAAGKAVVASPLAIEGLADGGAPPPLVSARSDEELGREILALLEEPERRIELAERAREWARRRLGWSRSAAAYEALYSELLGR